VDVRASSTNAFDSSDAIAVVQINYLPSTNTIMNNQSSSVCSFEANTVEIDSLLNNLEEINEKILNSTT